MQPKFEEAFQDMAVGGGAIANPDEKTHGWPLLLRDLT